MENELLCKSSCEEICELVHQLYGVWEKIGFKEEKLRDRSNQALEHMKQLLSRMVKEEQNLCDKLVELTQIRLATVCDICEKLEEPLPSLDDSAPIIDREFYLFRIERELKDCVQCRLDTFRKEVETEKHLCLRLGEQLTKRGIPDIPKKSELESIQEYIVSLRESVRQRLREINSIRRDMVVFAIELDIVHIVDRDNELDIDSQQLILKEDLPQKNSNSSSYFSAPSAMGITYMQCLRRILPQNFQETVPLTLEFIGSFRQTHEVLSVRVHHQREECCNILNRIHKLWSRLSIDESEQERDNRRFENIRECFVHETQQSSKEYLNSLKECLQKLESCRNDKLIELVTTLRQEVLQWWERCMFHLSSPTVPPPISALDRSCPPSIEVLDRLEQESAYCEKYYHSNEEDLKALEKWFLNFNTLKANMEKMKDPAVLTNRGGVLLKIEKENKKCQNSLRKIEAQLSTRTDDEEVEDVTLSSSVSRPVERINALEIIHTQWDQYQRQKENSIRERSENKKRQRQEDSSGTSSCGSSIVIPRTPQSKAYHLMASTQNRDEVAGRKKFRPNNMNSTMNLNETAVLRDLNSSSTTYRKALNSVEVTPIGTVRKRMAVKNSLSTNSSARSFLK